MVMLNTSCGLKQGFACCWMKQMQFSRIEVDGNGITTVKANV